MELRVVVHARALRGRLSVWKGLMLSSQELGTKVGEHKLLCLLRFCRNLVSSDWYVSLQYESVDSPFFCGTLVVVASTFRLPFRYRGTHHSRIIQNKGIPSIFYFFVSSLGIHLVHTAY